MARREDYCTHTSDWHKEMRPCSVCGAEYSDCLLYTSAPKTNLLVMDEPGTGLDQEGCKQFARGILKLKDRFETILLVTHSAYIEGLLSGETVYTVRKRKGRSRLYLQ